MSACSWVSTPFGGYAHLERARDRNARQHHRPAAVIFARLNDKAAIKLELFKAELAQKSDRGISGAEIVERDLHPELADHIKAALCHDRVKHEAGFRDFQFKLFGRIAGVFQDLAKLDRECRVAQLRRRNVDRKGDAFPSAGIGHCLAQHPQADGIDDARFLGNRDEDVGADLAIIRTVPTQQRFDRDDPRFVGAACRHRPAADSTAQTRPWSAQRAVRLQARAWLRGVGQSFH